MESEKKFSPQLQAALNHFMEQYSPSLISRNLRRMLLEYLKDRVKYGVHEEFPEFLDQLYGLFELLEVMKKEKINNGHK